MYQLIYTSAPRLLEAGKTGFGTVARSRELPQPLVAYLERISSYDRAENIGSFLYYSVYTMGGLGYHIFSRIADCGVDYTKRTNHIAHHWVMPDDEMGQPHHRGNTPAGVLLALQQSWQPSWQKLPQWFTGDIQVELRYPEMGRTWEKLTGQQDNQRWLNESDIQQGINLLLPAACNETDTLKLLHESFLSRADHGWGMGFTTAATSTINRKNYPLFCITQTQQEHGHSYLSGYQSIRVDHTLQPPVAATPSQPVPAASVETNYQPAGTFPGNAFPTLQTAPPPLAPVPMPAMPGVMPGAPLQPGKTAYPDFTTPERSNPLTAVCYAIIGAIVILSVLGGAYWYITGATKTSPAITENHKQQSKKKASDTETREAQMQQGKPISDSSTKQEQAIPSPPAEQQKQENIPTPTEQQEQTPPALVEPQKQPEAPTPTEQQGQTPPASAEQQPDISAELPEEYTSGQGSNESTGEPKEFSISIRELQNVEIEIEYRENIELFKISIRNIQVPLHFFKTQLPQYHAFYHEHDGGEQRIRDDRPAKIKDKVNREVEASPELTGAYKEYKKAELQYEKVEREYEAMLDAMKSSSSTSGSRQQRERRVSKVQKNKEVSNSKAAEQRLANQQKQYSAAQKKLEKARNWYNALREREEKELKKQWAKKCIVKFSAEEAPNDTSEVRIKTEFCISE